MTLLRADCACRANVPEWVEDSYRGSYTDAPADGRAWTGWGGLGGRKVVRGGSWQTDADSVKVFSRGFIGAADHIGYARIGFRPARASR